ncbi:uncharacterized protein LOC124888575 [Capsicum annuum]|uniref:uncharacterized protein LOC124888575 n=1 Tax=Capsicum annuum TaxID=4072 RepID=UPI001FB11FDE|nr:uncharacterized protein LOC124888575 [Capsicum annuum]
MRDEIFFVRKLPRFASHMCSYSDNDIYGSVCAVLNKEQFKNFCENNIFGYFMKKKQCVVQPQLCRCVMTLEVKGSSSSGIMICANGTSLSFTPMEFAIITRLNCVSNRYDFIFYEGVPNRMIEKYFNGAEIIQKRQLFLVFTEKVWGENNDEDAEKFAILYFLHSFVLSNIDTVVIPRVHFDLVDSGRYKDFPWGSLSFEDLARSLNNRLKAEGKFYLIQGMPLAIQMWLCECCSNVPPKIALKVVFKNIKPTEMELAKLEIPQKDDPPPKKINERSKKKQKVDSSTPVAKKPSGKKQVNIVDAHTQTRTPPHRAAKAAASSSKTKEGKQTARVIFPQVRQEFKGVREEFTRIRQLVKKKFKKMVKAIEHSKITDKKLDDTNLSDSQFTIPDELLPSLNAYRRESITRHPLATSEEEQIDEHFNDKKSESVVQDHCQENKENVGSSSKADIHGEVDLGTEEQIMTTPKIQELTTDEQRDETVLPDSQDIIPDDLLPSLNVYSSKSIIVHPSANRELQTSIPKLRIRRPSKFKESPYTMKFGSAVESSERHIRIFSQKHPFVYHPIDGIVDTKIVNKKGNADHYKRGKSTIPMMHFGIETVEDKNWFYTMGFPDQSWTDSYIDVCFYYLRKKSKYDPNRSYKFITVDCNFMNIIGSVHDVYFADAENLTAGGYVAHLNE